MIKEEFWTIRNGKLHVTSPTQFSDHELTPDPAGAYRFNGFQIALAALWREGRRMGALYGEIPAGDPFVTGGWEIALVRETLEPRYTVEEVG